MLNKLTPSKFYWFLKNFYIFIVIVIIYVPLLFIVALSFTGQNDRGNININFDNFTAINFVEIFKDSTFINAFTNSLLVVIVVTPTSLIIAIFSCIGMWYSKQKSKQFILNATRTNIALPEIITGIMLAILFIATWVGIGLDLGYSTVLMAHISFCTPYAIVAIYPKISKMNVNLVNASMDLGHSRLATYFKFVIPYLKSSIITAAIIVSTISFDDFIITILVNGNFETLGTAIFESRRGIQAWILTFGALLVILLIVIIVLISIYRIYKIRKESYDKYKK